MSWLYPSPALFQVSETVCDTFVKETEDGKEDGGRGENADREKEGDLSRLTLENMLKCRSVEGASGTPVSKS